MSQYTIIHLHRPKWKQFTYESIQVMILLYSHPMTFSIWRIHLHMTDGKFCIWYRKGNLYEQEGNLLIITYQFYVPHKGNKEGEGSLRTSCGDGREGRFQSIHLRRRGDRRGGGRTLPAEENGTRVTLSRDSNSGICTINRIPQLRLRLYRVQRHMCWYRKL
jgi:hypothetical protein